MVIKNISDIPREEHDDWPLFTGRMAIQNTVGDKEKSQISVSYVHFAKGVRNKMHTHSTDQVLIVTSGMGIIASESEETEIGTGDIVYIPKGEKHWHGATADSEFSHIAISPSGGKYIQHEK